MKPSIILLFTLFTLMIFISFYISTSIVCASDQTATDIISEKQTSTIVIKTGCSQLINTRNPIIRASIADPDVADVNVVSPNQIIIMARSEKAVSTTLILWQNNDRIKIFDIHIIKPVSRVLLNLLKARMKEITPSIEIEIMPLLSRPENGTIMLTGEVASHALLDRAVVLVKSFNFQCLNFVNVTGSQQVQLKVVIAEISKSGIKQMGINFLSSEAGLFKGGSNEGAIAFLSDKDKTTASSGITTRSASSSKRITSTQSINSPFATAFNLALGSSGNQWLGMLSLLKGQGLAKSLATPTLVTMNGQSANFQVGGSFPIPVQQEDGISIEQVEYGIILNFTPYIIDSETISLEVSPEVSTPDFSLGVTAGGVTVPGLTKREGKTTLQLKNGQTFAMAGLLKEDAFVTTSKTPFLGDIPFLGSLFTHKEVRHSETELVIMVTPNIVRPLNNSEIPILPGQDMENDIKDIDFFIKNTTSLKKRKKKETSSKFIGNTGFAK